MPLLQCDSWGDRAQQGRRPLCGPLSSPPPSVHAPSFAAAVLLLLLPSQLKQQQAQGPSDEAGFILSVTLLKIIAPPDKPSVCQVWQWRQCPLTTETPGSTSQAEASAFPSLLYWAGFEQTRWVHPSSNEGLCWARAGAGRVVGAMLSQCSSLAAAVNGQGCFDFSYIGCGCSIAQESPSAEITCEKTE